MAHTHVVTDGDIRFVIDPITRKITNETRKVVLMQHDHNSERITFELPRYIDGHDMAECNLVKVYFDNIDASNVNVMSSDDPELTDFGVDPEDENKVVCSWLIGGNATKYAGKLQFALVFACMTGATVDYQWSTEIYGDISVSKRLGADKSLIEPETIVGGTTPTHIMTIPFEASALAEVMIIYAQGGFEVFRKVTKDCVIVDKEIRVTLTQEDTLKLQNLTSVQIQLRVLTVDGSALASDIFTVPVAKVLNNEVLA